ncbi:hypothetical protein ACJMK2_020054 [Sinanodonta woodiana]|uniref:Uncharacterized protein n=1 Tax=Sinanodonta woodiana TaxID=1069815 RepID=A0ABD3U0D6_SINWO
MPKQKKNVEGVPPVASKASDDDSNLQDSQHSSPHHCSPLRGCLIEKKKINEMQKMLESFGCKYTFTFCNYFYKLRKLCFKCHVTAQYQY